MDIVARKKLNSKRNGLDVARFLKKGDLMCSVRSHLVTACMFVLVTSCASAQRNVTIHGAGGASCGTYVQVYEAYRPFIGTNDGGIVASQATANYWQYEEWIEGYLYGVDSWNQSTIRDYDRAGMQLWVYQYCQQHPLDVVANAALALYRNLGGPIPTGGDQRRHNSRTHVDSHR